MAKTPQEMEASMVANLPEKTGKSLEEWLKIVSQSKLAKHGEIVSMLKGEHGVGHGYANLIAARALAAVDGPPPGDEALVDAQYGGAKSALRPMYDALVAEIRKFGSDVELAPKKAYVSLRRSKQFGLIQPSTATRLDVGIQIKGMPPSARLEASGSFNAMVSHRVRVEKPGDVNAELVGWLREAYNSA